MLRRVKSVFDNPVSQRYLFNSSWMLAEQILRVLSGVFVGIYIARYLGPEQFGTLSYALAISAFLMAISRVGMDSVLVRELIHAPERNDELMGTAFWLMTAAAIACYIITAIALWNIDESAEIKLFATIVSASASFTSFLVVDYLYQSQVKAKFSSICKSTALFIMSVFKITLILKEADLVWFVVASVLDQAILAFLLLFSLHKSIGVKFLSKFNLADAKKMLASAWPMVLSALAVIIYMRIDQVMIKSMLGLHEVGIYSAAVKIFDAWFILPYTITISLLPAVAKLKQGDEDNYQKRLTQLFRLIIWLCIIAAIVASLISEPLMVLSFGEEYRASASLVNVVMWTSIFAAMGSVSARYFTVEKMEKKIATRTVLAALLNIGLNLILIPKYGIMGAAFATLACTFFSNYLMDWFDKDLQILLKIKHQAIFSHPFK